MKSCLQILSTQACEGIVTESLQVLILPEYETAYSVAL